MSRRPISGAASAPAPAPVPAPAARTAPATPRTPAPKKPAAPAAPKAAAPAEPEGPNYGQSMPEDPNEDLAVLLGERESTQGLQTRQAPSVDQSFSDDAQPSEYERVAARIAKVRALRESSDLGAAGRSPRELEAMQARPLRGTAGLYGGQVPYMGVRSLSSGTALPTESGGKYYGPRGPAMVFPGSPSRGVSGSGLAGAMPSGQEMEVPVDFAHAATRYAGAYKEARRRLADIGKRETEAAAQLMTGLPGPADPGYDPKYGKMLKDRAARQLAVERLRATRDLLDAKATLNEYGYGDDEIELL